MKSLITIVAIVGLLIIPASLYSQQTHVKVLKGKVKAQTDRANLTAVAGQKIILSQGKDPAISPVEPIVENLIQMYQWIEEEKTAARIQIDFNGIQIHSIVSDQLIKGAGLVELPNSEAKLSDTFRMGPTSLPEKPQFYDLQGNPIPYDLEQIDEQRWYIYLHFPQAVPPEGKFKLILISESATSEKLIWQEGPLWYVRMNNPTPYCLSYYRVILPESAILVESSMPIMTYDIQEGRTALTIRNYTGEYAEGGYIISFLWPEKDGTTFQDLPPQYRGLRDPLEAQLSREYRDQMNKILAGLPYQDQSTPLDALLTFNCALINQDKNMFISSHYSYSKDPQKAEYIDQRWAQMKNQHVQTQELLSIPPWPENPPENYIHPIYVCYMDSFIRKDTLAYIYQNGSWYMIGNMGNPRNTDVSVFKKFIR